MEGMERAGYGCAMGTKFERRIDSKAIIGTLRYVTPTTYCPGGIGGAQVASCPPMPLGGNGGSGRAGSTWGAGRRRGW